VAILPKRAGRTSAHVALPGSRRSQGRCFAAVLDGRNDLVRSGHAGSIWQQREAGAHYFRSWIIYANAEDTLRGLLARLWSTAWRGDERITVGEKLGPHAATLSCILGVSAT